MVAIAPIDTTLPRKKSVTDDTEHRVFSNPTGNLELARRVSLEP